VLNADAAESADALVEVELFVVPVLPVDVESVLWAWVMRCAANCCKYAAIWEADKLELLETDVMMVVPYDVMISSSPSLTVTRQPKTLPMLSTKKFCC
jgi:hypothetical protein